MTPVRRDHGRIEVIGMSSPVDEPVPLGPGTWDIDFTPAVLYTRVEDACAAEFPRLVRFLTLYCGDRETALDLAQETCARGCAQWSAVRRMQDQRAWFTKVAMNLARSRWRRQALERRVMTLLGSRPAAPLDRDVAEAVTVQAAIARLTPRQRAAVVLRYLDDLDLSATAAALRCSEGTVKKLTARGLATLKTMLDFELGSAGGDNG
jgi:RNA polymerase sigma factor (sigma-70 family)